MSNSIILNESLIDKQGLSDADVAELKHLHAIREQTFDKMYSLDPDNEDDLNALILYCYLIESLEYNLQRVWKFEQDSSKHSWWYRVPHCDCPKMDNADPISWGGRIYSNACKLHSRRPLPESDEIQK